MSVAVRPPARSARLGAGLRRALPLLCLLLAAAGLCTALERCWTAWRQHQQNGHLAAGTAPRGSDPRLLLGQAVRLESQQLWEEALVSYAEAEAVGGPSVRHAARVNTANLYLERGIAAASEDGNAQRALVLLQLAKTGYRRALREQPDDWNARYNLELAQRLLPDAQQRNWRRSGNQAELDEALKRDRPAWSDMVGAPRGMH